MISKSLLRQSAALRASSARRLAAPTLSAPASRLRPTSLAVNKPRWYSSTPEPETAAKAEEAQADHKASSSPEDELKTRLEAKDREIAELKDRYLRSVADFRNLQERTRRDMESARDFAISRFAKDLVDSVDNLDRALTTVPDDALGDAANKHLKDLHGGLKMTEQILMKTLSNHGLVRFDPSVAEEGKEVGEKFDPNKHDATFMAKVEDKEDGTVFQTVQKGYMLNGRVIRAAKVGVVKNT